MLHMLNAGATLIQRTTPVVSRVFCTFDLLSLWNRCQLYYVLTCQCSSD